MNIFGKLKRKRRKINNFRDSNPFKSSQNELLEEKMSIQDPKSDNLLREVVGDHKHDLKKQTLLHEEIRNDEDYDDWEYGTEPSYGKKV